jgi:hypothetical protein
LLVLRITNCQWKQQGQDTISFIEWLSKWLLFYWLKKSLQAFYFLTDYTKKHPPTDSFQKGEMYGAPGLCNQTRGNNRKAESNYLKMISDQPVLY